jgi:hypothetical protein
LGGERSRFEVGGLVEERKEIGIGIGIGLKQGRKLKKKEGWGRGRGQCRASYILT